MSALAAPSQVRSPLPTVRVRPLRPADAHLLDEVLDGMSPQSRYTRFHGPKPRLTASDRAYLAGVDGHDHIALVAVDDTGAPLGIARAVRLAGDPAVAEIAAEVVDPWQHRGLGKVLLDRLARRAAAVGIARFHAVVLAETGVRRSLRGHGWRAVESDGPSVTLSIDVWALMRG
jgi:GNAT superfamily N-acetyltransferase